MTASFTKNTIICSIPPLTPDPLKMLFSGLPVDLSLISDQYHESMCGGLIWVPVEPQSDPAPYGIPQSMNAYTPRFSSHVPYGIPQTMNADAPRRFSSHPNFAMYQAKRQVKLPIVRCITCHVHPGRTRFINRPSKRCENGPWPAMR